MSKSFKCLLVLLNILFLTQSMGISMTDKIKFDGETYLLSNSETKTDKYVYLVEDENIGNWHSQISFEKTTGSNPTELAAELAHQIQAETPGASVLVYPEAATIGYLTYPENKDFYEYNTVVFKKENSEIVKYKFAKRFYSAENGDTESARKAAINFAEKNNKKYMELINKLKI